MKGFIRINPSSGYGNRDSMYLRVDSIVLVSEAERGCGQVKFEVGGRATTIVTNENRETLVALIEKATK